MMLIKSLDFFLCDKYGSSVVNSYQLSLVIVCDSFNVLQNFGLLSRREGNGNYFPSLINDKRAWKGHLKMFYPY